MTIRLTGRLKFPTVNQATITKFNKDLIEFSDTVKSGY